MTGVQTCALPICKAMDRGMVISEIHLVEMMKRELLSSKEKAEMSDSLKSAFLANMSH